MPVGPLGAEPRVAPCLTSGSLVSARSLVSRALVFFLSFLSVGPNALEKFGARVKMRIGVKMLPPLLLLAAVLPGLARSPQRRQRRWAGKHRGTPATEDEAAVQILDTAAALKARHTWSRNLSAELSALYDRLKLPCINLPPY